MDSHTTQHKRTATTLDALRRIRGYSDQTLANRAGMSRSQVESRRHGRAPITLDDLERLAEALGVPTTVLLLDPADALRWLVENDAVDLGKGEFGWFTPSPDGQLVLDIRDSTTLCGTCPT